MEPNNIDRLGFVLKSARKDKGLTREQLAEIIDITPRYLMSLENENKKPSYDVLFKLIRELSIPADTIFYPENTHTYTNVEQLVRLLHMCNERDLKIITSTTKAILENK
jgi:Predicted transcriptional regulators